MSARTALIVRLSAMGDVVHALPLAANLRRGGWRVGWIVEAPFAPLLAGNPNLDRVFPVETKKWRRRPLARATRRALGGLRSDLAGFGASAVLDVQGNPKSWWACRLSPGARIVLDDRSVRRDWTRSFSSLRVSPPDRASHVSERCLALLAPLHLPVRETSPDARYLLGGSGPVAREFLASLPRPFALYHPGAGWGAKSWGEERFARLASRLLRERGIVPVVSWGPGDERRAETLSRLLDAPCIPGTGFADLARIMAEASFFAAGDTGPLHLADALGVPTLSLYGPTDPVRNGPARTGNLALWAGLACAPCQRRYEGVKPCLTAIDPDAAAAAALQWLPRP